MAIKMKVKRLTEGARIPQYQTSGAACFDLHADFTKECDLVQTDGLYVMPGDSCHLHTGLAFEVPEGHVMLVYSRSGQGFKHGVRLANSTGVIDSDYRGELLVSLHNDGGADFLVRDGDRIAQAMLVPLPHVELEEAQELSATERGENGGGSTGV